MPYSMQSSGKIPHIRQKSVKWAELSCGNRDFVTEIEYHTKRFLSRKKRGSDHR